MFGEGEKFREGAKLPLLLLYPFQPEKVQPAIAAQAGEGSGGEVNPRELHVVKAKLMANNTHRTWRLDILYLNFYNE